MIISLPWPNRVLHPNARCHWAIRASAAKKARRDAGFIAQTVGARALGWDRARLTITFSPPDSRRRDVDGMLSAAKPLLDGIADATGIDDSRFAIVLARGEPVKGGAVIVEIEPAEGAA